MKLDHLEHQPIRDSLLLLHNMKKNRDKLRINLTDAEAHVTNLKKMISDYEDMILNTQAQLEQFKKDVPDEETLD